MADHELADTIAAADPRDAIDRHPAVKQCAPSGRPATDAGDVADANSSKVASAILRAAEYTKLLKGDALRTATDTLRGTDGAVHLHPYRAIGIAAGLALLVGFFAARR